MLRKFRAELFLILGACLFAFNGIVAKLVLTSGLSAWRLTQVRCTGAFIIIAFYVLLRNRQSLRVKKGEIAALAAYGAIGMAAVQVGYFIAISRMPVSISLIIEFTAPIWIVLYIRFVKKKFVPKLMWFSIALGFGGLFLVARVWQGLTLDGIGVIAAFLDAFALAGYFLLGEKLGAKRSTESLTVWGFGFATIVWLIITPIWSFPFGVFSENINLLGIFSQYNLPGWVLFLWIVVMGTILPYILILHGIKELAAATSSVITMIEPVVAGGIAWVWLSETLKPVQLVGGVFVFMGIIAAERARRSTR